MSSITDQLGLLFAHELGHNLGLDHYFDLGIGNSDSIMDYNDCELEGNCELTSGELSELANTIASGQLNYIYELDSPFEYQSNNDSATAVSSPGTWLLLLLTTPLLLIGRNTTHKPCNLS